MRAAIRPLPQYVFMAWCLVKHRDNFTFTYTLMVPTCTLIRSFRNIKKPRPFVKCSADADGSSNFPTSY
jgi:hypothetical protein